MTDTYTLSLQDGGNRKMGGLNGMTITWDARILLFLGLGRLCCRLGDTHHLQWLVMTSGDCFHVVESIPCILRIHVFPSLPTNLLFNRSTTSKPSERPSEQMDLNDQYDFNVDFIMTINMLKPVKGLYHQRCRINTSIQERNNTCNTG